MNITKYSSHCFFENVNGIRFDDAYDIIKRKAYIKYVAEHHINYLHSQDDDMFLHSLTHLPYHPQSQKRPQPSRGESKKLHALDRFIFPFSRAYPSAFSMKRQSPENPHSP